MLIKGMEMPERCGQCFLRVGNCKQRIYMERRPKGCPLTEVKEPHGNLVDINQMVNDFWDGNNMMIGEHELEQIKTFVEAEE